ncbi:hypothetical protein niasHT_022310 [Heterodera trifolii]|uniref:Uncharacterized protein n=1 Tax=Heterodera trifolii TaxID=157864 RepID=A0ABD2KPA4_9BILA
MGVKPLIRAKTEVQLNYWPYYSSPVYSHAASYDHYKLGSMYQWFLPRAQLLPLLYQSLKKREKQRKSKGKTKHEEF